MGCVAHGRQRQQLPIVQQSVSTHDASISGTRPAALEQSWPAARCCGSRPRWRLLVGASAGPRLSWQVRLVRIDRRDAVCEEVHGAPSAGGPTSDERAAMYSRAAVLQAVRGLQGVDAAGRCAWEGRSRTLTV